MNITSKEAARMGAKQSTDVLKLSAPIRTVSETNAHEHWRYRQQRAKRQRDTVGLLLLDAGVLAWNRRSVGAERIVVSMTRIGKRKLDSDNLQSSFKHIRDGVAKVIGIDDGSDRFEWRYNQRVGKQYGIEIEIVRVL